MGAFLNPTPTTGLGLTLSVGQRVRITDAAAEYNLVQGLLIGNVSVPFVIESATSITAVVPAGASGDRIRVTIPTGATEATGFSFLVGNKPQIIGSLTATGGVGLPFSYAIQAINSPTAYNATNLPAGLTINSTTGVISGTPTTGSTNGTLTNVTITAQSSAGTATATLAVTIFSAQTAPSTTQPSSPVLGQYYDPNTGANLLIWNGSAWVDSGMAVSKPTTPYPGQLIFSKADGFWEQYQLSPVALTPGWAIVPPEPNPLPGSFTGTYNGQAAYIGNVVEVQYGNNLVQISPAGTAPVITSSLTASATIGTAFNYTIIASGSTPITFNATSLPSGLTFDGVNTISGTPT